MQKQAKKFKRTKLVIPPEAILAPVKTKAINELRVIKEVLKANRTNPGLKTERAKAIKGTAP
jgi:hypothetical protein